MSEKVDSILKHLASLPGLAHGVLEKAELKELLLSTGGEVFLAGRFYDITTKHLGVGVYKISTKIKDGNNE